MAEARVALPGAPPARPEARTAMPEERGATPHGPPEAAVALADVLDGLARVVSSLPAAHYARRTVGEYNASVGAHVRHCLDHVRALLLAASSGVLDGILDYESRRRGTPIESSPTAALAAIGRLRAGALALPRGIVDRPVLVRDRVAAAGEPIGARSTVGRELIFVCSHTTHHGAIIAAMVRRLGHETPERFGYAPSTIAFLEGSACAR
jgi:hypothetical protein